MIRVNLIKTEQKEFEAPAAPLESERFEKKPAVPTNLLIVAAIVLIAGLGLLLKRSIDRETNLLQAAKAEKKTLEPVLKKLDAVRIQREFLRRKITLINDLKARQGEAVRLMETLSSALPDWVWLSEARFVRRNLQLKGKALTNILVSDYMHNLEKSGLFEMVSLMGTAQKNLGGTLYVEFTLSANVPAPPGTAVPAPAAKAKKAP
jgi:Tfp pilus assembly protein PilN